MMSLRQQWHTWNNAEKVAFLQGFPEDVRIELLDRLTFPETGTEIKSFIDSLYEQEEKRRGIREPKWMEKVL